MRMTESELEQKRLLILNKVQKLKPNGANYDTAVWVGSTDFSVGQEGWYITVRDKNNKIVNLRKKRKNESVYIPELKIKTNK